MPVLPSRFAIDQVWEQKEERGRGQYRYACRRMAVSLLKMRYTD